MSVTISFRVDELLVARLDELARSQGVSRAAYLHSLVSTIVEHDPSLNVARLNQITEYSQAALAGLIEHFIPEKQPDIIALTAQRLEQFHGQK
jgi:predicted transcriptional regulator